MTWWGRTQLHYACSVLDEAAVLRLLADGADPNAPIVFATTPLSWAILGEVRECRAQGRALDARIVAILLAGGADPMGDVRAVRYAVRLEHELAVALLAAHDNRLITLIDAVRNEPSVDHRPDDVLLAFRSALQEVDPASRVWEVTQELLDAGVPSGVLYALLLDVYSSSSEERQELLGDTLDGLGEWGPDWIQ